MSNELLTKENLSTLTVWIYMIIGPTISAYITQEQFTTLIVIIIGVLAAIYSSKNKNTMFKNKECPVTEEEILNDEYVAGEPDEQ